MGRKAAPFAFHRDFGFVFKSWFGVVGWRNVVGSGLAFRAQHEPWTACAWAGVEVSPVSGARLKSFIGEETLTMENKILMALIYTLFPSLDQVPSLVPFRRRRHHRSSSSVISETLSVADNADAGDLKRYNEREATKCVQALLSCSFVFDKWLSSNSNCPVCRASNCPYHPAKHPVRMPPLQHLEIMLTISSKDARECGEFGLSTRFWHLSGFCFPIL
ncbi:hypothetical protein NC651_014686 [Populus alba x Populus x berolinensis]|nr:hypothetical protein NC651_014686 [Populus alba x Populus x berolinensis]